MGHEQIKGERLNIPSRDSQVEVKVTDYTHSDRVLNAIFIVFSHYKEAIKELSKV